MRDMPVMQDGAGKNQVNGFLLADYLIEVVERFEVKQCVIEQVGARPGQGVSSMFNFGRSYGTAIGVCEALYLPLALVSPHVWKRFSKLVGKPKDYSRTVAQQLYPRAELHLKKHHGRADAIHVARWAWLGQ